MRILKITAVVALALSSFAAENVAPTKTELEEMYNKAFRDFDANNFPQALKELDAIDARQPELAPSQNLRGVIGRAHVRSEVARSTRMLSAPLKKKIEDER